MLPKPDFQRISTDSMCSPSTHKDRQQRGNLCLIKIILLTLKSELYRLEVYTTSDCGLYLLNSSLSIIPNPRATVFV